MGIATAMQYGNTNTNSPPWHYNHGGLFLVLPSSLTQRGWGSGFLAFHLGLDGLHDELFEFLAQLGVVV